ncbi:hypothetical protein QN219_25420 [Sinorhizobium sp. 7-81]|uniref:hypothetical protein n=1 Tax=Sinorhizobium sp. 8-89 TaxID=3049089 RepID=UPI0024C2E604|nr:hypothetical protein [Sinorhizobium sp. 8-89]MDK1493348.1 hypothetical protein [Sinorhizobium sp. 8-89]
MATIPPRQPFTIDDMIEHDVLLERYEWLSAQILNKWKRSGVIRGFRGRGGKLVYPKIDICLALEVELNKSIEGK